MEILKNIIKKINQRYPDVVAIYLFGSVAADRARDDSDIDLAMLPAHPIQGLDLWKLAQEIAIELDRNVDLIDLLTASTVLRTQIITTGQRIYCSDDLACGLFETSVISEYINLSERRELILKAIKQRGRVYG